MHLPVLCGCRRWKDMFTVVLRQKDLLEVLRRHRNLIDGKWPHTHV